MTTQAEPKNRPVVASRPTAPKVSKKMREAADFAITKREKALRNLAKY